MSTLGTLTDKLTSTSVPTAEFAYIDESGNTGSVLKGGTRTYTLGCVLLPIDNWTDRLDLMVEVRRGIKKTYGVRMRDELKANYLLRGRGPLAGLELGDGQRRDIWQRALRGVSIVASGVFAVVIDKERASGDPFERAWTYLLQRLRIRSTADQRPIMIVHDDGEADRVRTTTRAFRRHSFAPNGRSVSAPLLVEDPIPRNSAHSYFVQAADLAAYAAFRRIQPPNRRNGSVCSEEMWNVLEPKWLTEVQARGDGLVLYPR